MFRELGSRDDSDVETMTVEITRQATFIGHIQVLHRSSVSQGIRNWPKYYLAFLDECDGIPLLFVIHIARDVGIVIDFTETIGDIKEGLIRGEQWLLKSFWVFEFE